MSLHLLGVSRSADVGRWGDRCAEALDEEARSRETPSAETAFPSLATGFHWITQGDLSAAAVPSLPQSAGPLTHAALQMVIHRHGDVLPLRFGIVLPDEQSVRNLLRQRRYDLVHDLERLKGTCEIGLRIEVPQGLVPADRSRPIAAGRTETPAAEYLAARRARYQWQDRLENNAQRAADTCIQAVRGLCQSWQRLSPEPPGTVRLAFLVQRNRSRRLAERLQQLEAETTGGQYTLVGPWPPYSFVGSRGLLAADPANRTIAGRTSRPI